MLGGSTAVSRPRSPSPGPRSRFPACPAASHARPGESAAAGLALAPRSGRTSPGNSPPAPPAGRRRTRTPRRSPARSWPARPGPGAAPAGSSPGRYMPGSPLSGPSRPTAASWRSARPFQVSAATRCPLEGPGEVATLNRCPVLAAGSRCSATAAGPASSSRRPPLRIALDTAGPADRPHPIRSRCPRAAPPAVPPPAPTAPDPAAAPA